MPAQGTGDGNAVRSRCYGVQRVSKHKEGGESANHVRVYVACVRLRRQRTDVVMSYNVSVQIAAGSSSAETADPAAVASAGGHGQALKVFCGMADSLAIHDYGLFGG